MYRFAILQSLLQTCLSLTSDLGAATLLTFSTAVDRNVWEGGHGQLTGQSQKYEHFLPPPPGFRNQGTFGMRERPGEERSSRDLNRKTELKVSGESLTP